jgi:membrane fusion protein (multidrug efflux system)
VSGNVVEITPLVTGTVTSIGADDGDLVHAGQVLLQFDPADSEVALQSAEAKLARSVRQVRGLYSNVDALKAQVETRQAELQKAQQNYNRRKVLADSGAIAQEEIAHARDDLTVAQAAVNSARSSSAPAALVDDTVVSSHPKSWPPPPTCARPTSTTPAPPWWRRSPAMWPSAPCSWASACSRAPRPWR